MSNTDTITEHKAVEIHYTLTNDAGEEVDSSRDVEPLPYIHGTESLVPGLEKELDGKVVGDKIVVSVAPAEGYGELNPELTQVVPRDLFQFDGDIEVGMRFEAEAEHGVELVTVVALDAENITIDANHPLAGQTLNFDVEIVSIREATSEELEHGHVHSEGGCGH
ncbi:MAG: peptidylprolyl isomerase [Ghiorsea sp.]